MPRWKMMASSRATTHLPLLSLVAACSHSSALARPFSLAHPSHRLAFPTVPRGHLLCSRSSALALPSRSHIPRVIATGSRSPNLLVRRLARGMSPFVALKLVRLPGLAARLARRRRLLEHTAVASSRMPVPRVIAVGSRSLVLHSRLARRSSPVIVAGPALPVDTSHESVGPHLDPFFTHVWRALRGLGPALAPFHSSLACADLARRRRHPPVHLTVGYIRISGYY
ncbi:hypothetical protein K488DRAFT_86115 [Vararia minispora EC-137]|uniref:Uncharacterized protein n=1 Tax=Vararia minispora EC-137 TaxID=1314806 RepID=A0ACB8QKA6_9AGAM|nr:hypothetical protein K488DRAFT_86115 [Vararia minispora EC-137]